MKNVLRMTPVIYFNMEPDETQEEAEERLLNILNNDLNVESYSAVVVGENNETV